MEATQININVFRSSHFGLYFVELEDGTRIAEWPTMSQVDEWVRNRGGFLGSFDTTFYGQAYRKGVVQDARTTFVCGLKPTR